MNAALREPKRHRLSRDNYYRMAEVGILAPDARVELINGEIIDMVPIGNTHAGTVDFLALRLMKAVDSDAILRVQGPVSLGDYSEPEPDLSLLKSVDDFYRSGESHPSAKDILFLVEVAVSTLHYDRDIKIPLYANHGVSIVWLVVPEQKKMWMYSSPRRGQYEDVQCLADIKSVALPGLPGRTVDLTGLFDNLPN